MKSSHGQSLVQKLTNSADVFLDPFRPGVMERLNVGPEKLCASNEKLIYARLTGFGQTGPMSTLAGHDINYIAQSGVLSSLVDSTGKPTPPINLVADFAGGGLLLSNGIMAALIERSISGQGQVLDLSMSEGSAYASSFLWQMRGMLFTDQPGQNMLDGGAHFYGCYATADNRWMAVGSIEPQFYAELVRLSGIDVELSDQQNQETWPELKNKLTAVFKTKTMAEWTSIFGPTDACVTPVLTFDEAQDDTHNKERSLFFETDNGSVVPNSVPKFSRSGNAELTERPDVGADTRDILGELDLTGNEIDELIEVGAVSE